MKMFQRDYLKFDYEKFNKEKLRAILSKFGNSDEIKVLYLSSYYPDYTRTEVMLRMFDDINVKVEKAIFGNQKFRYIKTLAYFFKNKKKCDVIFVAFRGHEIMPFIRLFTRKPIIFDCFVSVYDTLCCDRQVFSENSVIAGLLKFYDKLLCKISNIVLVDTDSHKKYFESQFNAKNIDFLYVGVNTEIFKPLNVKKDNQIFNVFWYGRANPLQGVDVVLKSAELLANDKKIHFKIVGPVRKKYEKFLKDFNADNVEFVDFIPYKQLPIEICKADVCLGGQFSDKDKAARVIAGKTFQFLACKKTTILADNPANREVFRESDMVHFVKPDNPEELVSKILELSRE